MFENFLAKLAGKYLSKKLDLQGGSMDQTKPWYQSKGIWTGIVTVLLAGYSAAASQFHVPPVPEFVYVLLGALGIYTRATADTKISAS